MSEAILWELFLQAGPVGEFTDRYCAWVESLRVMHVGYQWAVVEWKRPVANKLNFELDISNKFEEIYQLKKVVALVH